MFCPDTFKKTLKTALDIAKSSDDVRVVRAGLNALSAKCEVYEVHCKNEEVLKRDKKYRFIEFVVAMSICAVLACLVYYRDMF